MSSAQAKHKRNTKKYTLDKVIEIIKNGGDKLISDEYKNNKTKLKIKCHDCNNIYMMNLNMFMHGSRCRDCSYKKRNKNKQITKNQIKKLMKQRKCILLKQYRINNRLRVKYKCNLCLQEFDIFYHNYKTKTHCVCVKKNRKIDYNFVKQYIEKNGDKLISEKYVNAKTKLLIKCGKCKKIIDMCWDSYQKGCRCRLCSGRTKFSYDAVKLYVDNTGDELISNLYINCRIKLQIKCSRCKKIYKISFCGFKNGNRCQLCGIKSASDKKRLKVKFVKDYIKEFKDKLLSGYINNRIKLDIQCNKCEKIYKMCFSDFKFGNRCICHNLSIGERKIEKYLTDYNISFTMQKWFAGCKNKQKLRFDFYLKDKYILIEFDGIQHFEPVKVFGGKEKFNKAHRNDIIKNIFCIKKNKKLLRVCYKNIKNISKILDDYLNDYEKNNHVVYSNDIYKKMIVDTNHYLTQSLYYII